MPASKKTLRFDRDRCRIDKKVGNPSRLPGRIKEGSMQITEIVGLVLMIPCVIWLLAQIVIGFKRAKRAVTEQDLDVPVKCEECGLEYTATLKELIETSPFNKDAHAVSLQTPVAGATVPTSLKRKCRCPNCNKVVWASVLEARQLSLQNTAISVPILIKHLAIGAIPFFVLIAVSEMFGM